ncbi:MULTISPECIES: alkaline shock response membrane anchor protein AmaP [Streptomyces]|uniref:Alkaline shock response membrane anchor protein AmaP n=1 Tax=Streptomyces fuscus TaxID=3048495 RepID=A0ABT7IVR8_9ACTN|nr:MULTISPECIES: alkaline shock response membrane anchor protein AmaP [Streptomyces]MCM1977334.1 alkaline shock response membrane anchor protein AmaP [Streptomyces sp. G1]MDL2076690.1 alkaline shock response membrane anchor protein AmaP [Streptomyces fuscus]
MRAMLRAVNRVVLAVLGVLLILLGGSVLAVGLGLNPPSWWIHGSEHDVLLSDSERTRWRDEGWWWPVVIAVLAVLLLLLLWWLTANLRRRRLTEVLVDTGDGEGALLRGRALEHVLTEEAGLMEGVHKAHTRLTGRRNAPEARVRLLLEPHVDPGTALTDLTDGALTHARDSAGLEALPAEVRLRAAKHRAERVS